MYFIIVCVDLWYLFRQSKDGVAGTASSQHVSDEVLLAVVRGEDSDPLRRETLEPHEHEQSNRKLSLSEILVEVRCRFALSHAVEIPDIDELIVESKAGVGHCVLRPMTDVGKVAERLVAPVVEPAEAGAGATLSVKMDGWHAQTDEAGEERLFQVGVFLEGHVLDHWRELRSEGGEERGRGGEGREGRGGEGEGGRETYLHQ